MKAIKHASTSLLLSTLMVCVLSVALIGAVSLVSVRRSARDDVTELADALLDRAGAQFSFYLSQARRIAYEVFEDTIVKALGEEDDADPRLVVYVNDYLHDTLVLHDYIHAVSVSTPTRLVAARTHESFESDSYSALMSAIYGLRPFMPIPRRRFAVNGRQRNILTLYYHGFGYVDAPAERFVFVSIDADRVSSFLGGAEKATIVITDAGGIILAASSPELIGRKLPDATSDSDAVLSAISRSVPINADSPFVRAASWREGRLKGVYIGEASVFTPTTTTVMITISLAVIGVCALATGLVLWLARTLYLPISSVFDAGAETIGAIGPKDKLTSIADRIVAHLDDLSKAGKLLLTVEETSFLRRLLVSVAPMSKEVVTDELIKSELVQPGESFVVQIVVLRVDDSRRFVAGSTFSTIRSLFASLRADTDVIFRDLCTTQVVEMADNHLAILCFLDAEHADIEAVVRSGLRILLEHVPRTYQVSVTAGVSKAFDQIQDLRMAYQFAYGLTNYRLLLGPGRIITAADIGARRSDALRDEKIKRLIVDLAETTRSCDSVKFQVNVDTLFELLQEYAYLEILSVVTELAYSLSNMRIVGLRNGHAARVRYVDLYDQLSMAENLEELNEVITRIHHRVVQNLEEVRTQASDHIIHEGLAYIRANQDDPMLSASNVAEQIGITPQYFSQIFHRATGKSFPHHLNDLRLQKAYELFRTDKRATVQTVCRTVGYSSRNHFTALFKAKYAVTPSQMRRRSLDLVGGQDPVRRKEEHQ
jgi:AraC-like DNA-binding protein